MAKNVLLEVPWEFVEKFRSPTMSPLACASAVLGKVAGHGNHLALDIIDRRLFTSPPEFGRDSESIQRAQKHMAEMLSRGAMGFRPSPQFKEFASALDVWLDSDAVVIAVRATSENFSAQAKRLGPVDESAYLCAACLKVGIEPRYLAKRPDDVDAVADAFDAWPV